MLLAASEALLPLKAWTGAGAGKGGEEVHLPLVCRERKKRDFLVATFPRDTGGGYVPRMLSSSQVLASQLSKSAGCHPPVIKERFCLSLPPHL